jgi:galactose-1-phosphate uridylyltransferase
MTAKELSRDGLAAILQSPRLEDASFDQWLEWFRAEPGLAEHAPQDVCVSDPRTGDRVLFNPARARRPHDNRDAAGPPPECIVCTGRLTRVIDVADLSNGFTFVNKNLYPAAYPHRTDGSPAEPGARRWDARGVPSYGLHLLQWSSSRHDEDLHTMPPADRLVVFDRLAALERKLLRESAGRFPSARTWGGPAGVSGFVQVIKNFGAPVGGSVAHGHQQIALTNVMPRRARDDWRFEQERGETFAASMLRENPPELLLKDYGGAALVIPYFMRRPYDMMLVQRETRARYLHELDRASLAALAEGWRDGILLMRGALARMGRKIAFNVVLHVGPGAGIYTEFLPYTQEVGGLEQSGLWICQADPRGAADELRSILDGGGESCAGPGVPASADC